MFKIAFVSLLSLPLMAGFFPPTIQTSVKSVEGSTITLESYFPVNGMSGVVVHNYGKDVNAVTNYLGTSNGKVSLIQTDILHHDELPTIKTPISVGDKVIGGYLYDTVLLLAPDADTYAKITSEDKKKWIHPDLFALYLSTEGENKPTRENLAQFAKKYQIGLIYIVQKNSAILLDPISGKIVGQKTMTNIPAQGQFPFYMRFKKEDSGWWFGSSNTGDYYETMQAL
ncbi:MAG: hypothetical protein RLZZ428_481 [Pseudomonadota bacterium]